MRASPPSSTSSLLGLFRQNRVFRNFLTASTVSMIGSHAFDIAMPLYVLQKTHSALSLALVTMCLNLPYFLMAPLTGFSADHLDKRRLMIFSDVGQILCMAFLLYYDYSATSPLWPVCVTIFAAKSLLLLSETVSSFQLIPGLVAPAELTTANTLFLSFHRVVQMVAPLLAGILMSIFGVNGAIVANMVSFIATLAFTWSLPNLDQMLGSTSSSIRSVTVRGVSQSFVDSLRYIWSSGLFRPFILLMFLWNLSPLTLNSPTLTYYFTVTHHFTASQYGTVVSLFGALGIVGFIASSAMYQHGHFGRIFSRSCYWQAAMASVALLAMGFPVAFALFYGVSRIGSSVLSLGTFMVRQTRVPKHQAGAVNACLRMFFMSAAPLSSLMQGYLITHLGIGVPMVIGAACLWAAHYYARKLSAFLEHEESSAQTATAAEVAAAEAEAESDQAA